jgi:hypothetical protein
VADAAAEETHASIKKKSLYNEWSLFVVGKGRGEKGERERAV